MTRQLPIVLTLISSIATAQAAESDSNFYYGISFGGGEIDIDPASTAATGNDTSQSDIKDFGLTLGYELASFLALEGQIGLGSNDNGSLAGDAMVTRAAGFLRLNYPADKVNAYLLGGVGTVLYDFAGTTFDEVFPAFGAGVDLFGNDTTALSLGFLLQPGDDIDYSVIKFGFNHYFGGPK